VIEAVKLAESETPSNNRTAPGTQQKRSWIKVWDLVRVALGGRAAIFQIALVTVLDEVDGHADGGAAVRQAVAELVDGLGLVVAGEAKVVVRAIDRDVRGDVVAERLHQRLKVLLTAHFAEVLGGEVAMHTGTVPVALDGLAMQLHVHLVLLAEAHHQIARGPHIVGRLGGAFREDLELPLALGHFGIDAFVVDAGGETKLPVLFYDLAGNIAHVLVANAAIVGTLGNIRVASLWEAKRTPILIKEVLLLQAHPKVRIVLDRRAVVGGVRC
jgi:hypothetical protein